MYHTGNQKHHLWIHPRKYEMVSKQARIAHKWKSCIQITILCTRNRQLSNSSLQQREQEHIQIYRAILSSQSGNDMMDHRMWVACFK